LLYKVVWSTVRPSHNSSLFCVLFFSPYSDSLQCLSVAHCPMLRELSLGPASAKGIRAIRGEAEWWEGVEWHKDEKGHSVRDRFLPYFRSWHSIVQEPPVAPPLPCLPSGGDPPSPCRRTIRHREAAHGGRHVGGVVACRRRLWESLAAVVRAADGSYRRVTGGPLAAVAPSSDPTPAGAGAGADRPVGPPPPPSLSPYVAEEASGGRRRAVQCAQI
ncbi:hypothetical protein Taro_056264, partial [Colocasia esculenta]|nr:hypothetical protein [Colocasia esculenta]